MAIRSETTSGRCSCCRLIWMSCGESGPSFSPPTLWKGICRLPPAVRIKRDRGGCVKNDKRLKPTAGQSQSRSLRCDERCQLQNGTKIFSNNHNIPTLERCVCVCVWVWVYGSGNIQVYNTSIYVLHTSIQYSRSPD